MSFVCAPGILAGIKDGEAFTAGEWGAGFSDQMTPKLGDLIAKGKSGLCGFASKFLLCCLANGNLTNPVV
jgi:ureidoacrylate peracid hydrolase